MRTLLDRLNWQSADGQTVAEYSVVLAVIAPAIIVALALLSSGVASAITSVVSTLAP